MTEGMKILEGDRQFFILETLNSLSFRSFFFTILAKRKRFINPFFRFLNFFNKSAEMPQNNSWVFFLIPKYSFRVHSLST
jgi:hypothetical protein